LIALPFAKQFFPNENPVGQQIAVAKGMGPPFEEPARTIVGVVGNTHDAGLDQDTPPLMVVPDTQVLDAMTELNAKIVPLRWAVRTHGDPRQLTNVIAEQLRQASGGFPVARIKTMEEIVSSTTSRQTFNMMLLSIFGAIALTLATSCAVAHAGVGQRASRTALASASASSRVETSPAKRASAICDISSPSSGPRAMPSSAASSSPRTSGG